MDGPPAATLDVHVYTGADASFVWYEDAGDGYAYETGACARVTLTWDEAGRTLRVSEREGSFAGMVADRTLDVLFHTPGRFAPSERTIRGFDGVDSFSRDGLRCSETV